ncbi:uncharacterized protein BDW70DRAFT_116608 [Aspergillus foveolatus]|uniref:uncharacterized protein n=1 Tax=Aspergillus foveolatus TaxID=210207 RepID=UPI003CCE4D3D
MYLGILMYFVCCSLGQGRLSQHRSSGPLTVCLQNSRAISTPQVVICCPFLTWIASKTALNSRKICSPSRLPLNPRVCPHGGEGPRARLAVKSRQNDLARDRNPCADTAAASSDFPVK